MPQRPDAYKCGPIPKLRKNWRELPEDKLTKGELVCRFTETHLRVPDGIKVGEPIVLDDFQIAYILAVVDNPAGTRNAILSMARRNGKSFIVAAILLAYLVGPLSAPNQTVASGANSRDQAALVFRLMSLMVQNSPEISRLVHIVPSGKRIVVKTNGATYQALSADAKTGYGQSFRVVVLDEAGQIVGPTSDFVNMLRTSQGSYVDPVFFTISTQAASDADFLSVQIDDAIRSQDPHTVCHVYAAPEDCALDDRNAWLAANPGLGVFRSEKDLAEQLKQASRLSSMENSARNLLLNQRVALVKLWLTASAWKECAGPIDIDIFRDGRPVSLGLDLSQKTDLTAAVLSTQDDDGVVHLLPLCFAPMQGMEQRELRDKAPYMTWVREEYLTAVPGAVISYDWVTDYLARWLRENEIEPSVVAFDRWRIESFRLEAERNDFCGFADWRMVGQGFKDMGPRLETFEGLLLEGKIRHGNHPLFNMAVASAIAVSDPAGSKKLEKSKSTQRIDPLVAAVMAVHETANTQVQLDVEDWILV